jgi:hypothetical protein
VDPSGLESCNAQGGNDECIGPVPQVRRNLQDGDGIRGPRCDNALGVTGCNFTSGEPNANIGLPYSVICATEPIWSPCVFAHEQNHREYLSQCCANTRKCLEKRGDAAGKKRCLDKYNEWFRRTYDARECAAYQLELKCLNGMTRYYCTLGHGSIAECFAIEERKSEVQARIGRHCNSPLNRGDLLCLVTKDGVA